MKTIGCLCVLLLLLISLGGTAHAHFTPLMNIGVFGNRSIPGGSLDETSDSANSWGAKIGIGIIFFGAELTFSRLDFKGSDGAQDSKIDILDLGIFFSYFDGEFSPVAPFCSVGIGHCMVENGTDGPGARIGLGLLLLSRDIKNISIDISGNYHHIFNSGGGTDFVEPS